MELRQLRYFVQVVESGSLAKASKLIYIAQPALSRQLAKLEAEIGKPLLLRSARGVVPTAGGLALYKHAKFLLRHVSHAVYAAREDSPVAGMVTVGLSPATGCVLGLPLLLALRAQHPAIVLNVVEGPSGHLYDMARAGTLDVAILFESSPALGMSVEPLIEEELALIMAADAEPPGGGAVPSVADLAGLPLILATRAHRTRRYLEAEFERLKLPLNLAAEIDSLPLSLAAVRHGLGATIQPLTALRGEAHPEAFRAVALGAAGLTRSCYLYGPGPEQQFPAAAVVLSTIKELVEQLARSGAWAGTLPAPSPRHGDDGGGSGAKP